MEKENIEKSLEVNGEVVYDGPVEDIALTVATEEPVAEEVEETVTESIKAKIDAAVQKKLNEYKSQVKRANIHNVARFVKQNRKMQYAESADQAYAFYRYCASLSHRDPNSRDQHLNWVNKNLRTKANTPMIGTGSGNDGQSLVPEEFDSKLIDLRALYGVLRGAYGADVRPMSSDTKNITKIIGRLTAKWSGEAVDNKDKNTKMQFQNIALVAKKLMVSCIYTEEWDEDSMVKVGDLLIKDCADGLAYEEDRVAFLGAADAVVDGSITGLKTACTGAKGIVTGSVANSDIDWSKFVIGDFTKAMGLVASYIERPAWYCSRAFYFNAMLNLAYHKSTNATEVVDGVERGSFLGYPVIFTEVLPSVGAEGGELVAFFGDLNQAVIVGDRRGIAVKQYDQGTLAGVNLADNDMLGIKVNERIDIVPVSYGTATDAGSMVAIYSAN